MWRSARNYFTDAEPNNCSDDVSNNHGSDGVPDSVPYDRTNCWTNQAAVELADHAVRL